MNIPVAFFVFNRPGPTEKVFARIAEARPPVLFVVADGPRPSRPDDVDRCAAVRRIVDDVDWPCRVVRLYADSNLGCTARVVSGIEAVMGDLRSRGVEFLEYDFGEMGKTENGLMAMGEYKAAWFKDSEGNILAVTQ